MTKNKIKFHKNYFQANQQEIFQLPEEIKTLNTLKLVENYTTILPEVPSEYKTREVTSTLGHIDNLIQEIDFYQRQRRKSYLCTLMEKLAEHMDESMINVDDLKDYQLLGNSLKNIEYSYLHKSKEQNSKDSKSQLKTKNITCIKITKQQQGVDVPFNVYLQLKRRKSTSRSRGTKYLNSIIAIEENKFILLNSIKDDRTGDKGYFIKNIDVLESYRKSGQNINLERAKVKPIFGTSNDKPQLSKEASGSSKHKSNALFNTFKTFNIEKTGYLNDKSREGRCYKCFNYILTDSFNKCVVCNAKYHNSCKTMIDLKIETSQQQISKFKYAYISVNSKVCSFCHKIVLQKLSSNANINPKLGMDMKSGEDEENEIAMNNSTLREILIKQHDLPAINYKCQKLEDGIIKLNSQNNMNNYLFMKFAHKLMKEVVSGSQQ